MSRRRVGELTSTWQTSGRVHEYTTRRRVFMAPLRRDAAHCMRSCVILYCQQGNDVSIVINQPLTPFSFAVPPSTTPATLTPGDPGISSSSWMPNGFGSDTRTNWPSLLMVRRAGAGAAAAVRVFVLLVRCSESVWKGRGLPPGTKDQALAS